MPDPCCEGKDKTDGKCDKDCKEACSRGEPCEKCAPDCSCKTKEECAENCKSACKCCP